MKENNGKIYFISDVHLGFFKRDFDYKREELLLAFLEKIKLNCSELVIIGDLFDYWFDYKTVIPRDFYLTL
ncbi:MAG TPA: UDP-2,3-diacylglucosamine diphosphatase, partial [Candidatus Kapabacteria bacterium]|nr:UDP-2,3-diacylglucosamine diphosphatase [Candidatus Kapabacteria bacterium]